MMEIVLISSMLEVGDNMPLTKKQQEQYFHTTFLKEIGEEGQLKLLRSKVAVVGCGGLASSALIYLTSIGVGNITIIDNDFVSLSNLPRQNLFTYDQCGELKVLAAKERLEKINPDVTINMINQRLNESNASKLLSGHDIVLDCTDNFETKFLINDTCLKLNTPFVIAGVRDYQGQVSTCIPNKTNDFKSLFSTLPINIDDEYKNKDQGVFPMSVGVVADIAASEVVKCMLNIGELLIDKMLIINLLNNHYQIIKF